MTWTERLKILRSRNDRFRASTADLPSGTNSMVDYVWYICLKCYFRTCYNPETGQVWRMNKIDENTPCPDCGRVAWRIVHRLGKDKDYLAKDDA